MTHTKYNLQCGPYPSHFSCVAGSEERGELHGANRGGHGAADPRDGVGGHPRANVISHSAFALPACSKPGLSLCHLT